MKPKIIRNWTLFLRHLIMKPSVLTLGSDESIQASYPPHHLNISSLISKPKAQNAEKTLQVWPHQWGENSLTIGICPETHRCDKTWRIFSAFSELVVDFQHLYFWNVSSLKSICISPPLLLTTLKTTTSVDWEIQMSLHPTVFQSKRCTFMSNTVLGLNFTSHLLVLNSPVRRHSIVLRLSNPSNIFNTCDLRNTSHVYATRSHNSIVHS